MPTSRGRPGLCGRGCFDPRYQKQPGRALKREESVFRYLGNTGNAGCSGSPVSDGDGETDSGDDGDCGDSD